MKDVLEIANQTLLNPAELNEQQLQRVLDSMMVSAIDNADIYCQVAQQESWSLEEGVVKEGGYSIQRGVGVRAISGEKTGFAYSDDIMLPTLLDAAKAARSIALQGQAHQVKLPHQQTSLQFYQPINPLLSLSNSEKIAFLQSLDNQARSLDPRIIQVMISLASSYEVIFLMGSDGTLAADVRPLVRLNVSVIAEEKGRREHGVSGGGGRTTYQYFLENGQAEDYVNEAVRQATLNLGAKPAPAGTMPVVLGAGWPGVLLHEAIGHGLEADFNRKGTSVYSGQIGQQVASPLCTIVDDGTLPEKRGSLNIDDEGVPTQCTTLIEKGILKTYMQDKLNARLMGMQPTGNGRRESYSHLPMPRMTNTYMLPGPHNPQEIIASVKRGLYAVNFAGGQVDITSGKFVFSASEAYMIEDGKITYPVKGATLIGNGPEVLTKVSMVGNDLQLDKGVGTCGKEGQSVPVGVGQPTLLIDELTVGGTQA